MVFAKFPKKRLRTVADEFLQIVAFRNVRFPKGMIPEAGKSLFFAVNLQHRKVGPVS